MISEEPVGHPVPAGSFKRRKNHQGPADYTVVDIVDVVAVKCSTDILIAFDSIQISDEIFQGRYTTIIPGFHQHEHMIDTRKLRFQTYYGRAESMEPWKDTIINSIFVISRAVSVPAVCKHLIPIIKSITTIRLGDVI